VVIRKAEFVVIVHGPGRRRVPKVLTDFLEEI